MNYSYLVHLVIIYNVKKCRYIVNANNQCTRLNNLSIFAEKRDFTAYIKWLMEDAIVLEHNLQSIDNKYFDSGSPIKKLRTNK